MGLAFGVWLDAFFDAYYRQWPVNATFIGVHSYDERLPDFSAAGQADIAASADRLLHQLDDLPLEPLTPGQQLDRQLAQGFLEIARWEAGSAHYTWGNPSLFTGEAVFGVLSLLLRPFAPLADRLEHAAPRMAAIPRLLEDGRSVLHDAPRAWCARARRECAGALLLLDSGLDRLLYDARTSHRALRNAADDPPISEPLLRRAAHDAYEAFARFDAFVASELEPNATDAYACGAEVFDLLLRRAHFLEFDAEALERLAVERMIEEEAAIASGGPPGQPPTPMLQPRTPDLQPRSAEELQPRTLELQATREAYLARFDELWHASRALAIRADVVSFPDWPVRYIETPAWLRDAAPHFYFLPYRAPAPHDPTPVVDYFVPTTADDSTIKLNHVLHHGSLGHHIQNWHAARAESRIGRIAAVDCASRIAMLCGGTMAEGWASYATDLADEAGFLTPAESFAQHVARLRMAARALVDIRLHQGRNSLDEAAAVYIERVGMTRDAAMAEAVKNSLFPGAACMYLAGWEAIWRLRRDLRVTPGGSLRAFHDRLLSIGSVPVALASRALREAGEVPALASRANC